MKHSARHDQRGAATLVVVMVLFFIVSLVAAYTSRNLIFEQRTASNQMRSTQALETAEAGLEWALSMLNTGRIDTDCAPSNSPADTSFRERYLQIDTDGNIFARPNPAGGDLAPVCVYTGSNTDPWNCKCPTTGASSPTAPSTTQSWPAFKLRFQRILASHPANAALPLQPGVVRVQVVGCTRLDTGGDPCLTFDGQGAFNEGRVQISANLALTGGASSPPQVALMALGAVNIGGTGISAYNSKAGGSGITVQAGGIINAGTSPVLVSAPGSPGGPSTLRENDSSLILLATPAAPPSVYTAADRMFSAVFNTRPDTFRTQQAAVEVPCTGSPAVCTTEKVRSVTRLNPWRPVWVNGNLQLNDSNDIGAANDPVVMVVNGNVEWTSGANSTIYGVVYSRSATWTTGGAGRIIGAAIAEGTVAGSGTTTFAHDPDLVRLARWNSGSFVRVPGSWKDYYQQ